MPFLIGHMDSAFELFQLPADILRHKILPFVPLKYCVRLDTAVGNGKFRSEYWNCLSGFMYAEWNRLTSVGLTWLISRNVQFKTIELDTHTCLDTHTAPNLRRLFKGLTCVIINSGVSKQILRRFVDVLTHHTLKILYLCRCDETDLLPLFANQNKLLDLTIAWSVCFTDDIIDTIITYCKALRALTITNNHRINNDVLFAKLLSGLNALERLDIRYTYGSTIMCHMIGLHAPQLKTLNLGYGLDDTGLVVLAKRCSLLESINISETGSAVTSTGLIAASAYFAKLKSFTFFKDLASLVVLDIDVVPFFHQVVALTSLHMSYLSCDAVCRAVPYWRQLHALSLIQCDLTDTAIELVARHCRQLKDLTLAGCPRLTDAAMYSLALDTPQLEELALRHCGNITDDGLIAVLQHCLKLKRLYVLANNLVTNRTLQARPRNDCIMHFLVCPKVRVVC